MRTTSRKYPIPYIVRRGKGDNTCDLGFEQQSKVYLNFAGWGNKIGFGGTDLTDRVEKCVVLAKALGDIRG